jgi:hypothetical protein
VTTFLSAVIPDTAEPAPTNNFGEPFVSNRVEWVEHREVKEMSWKKLGLIALVVGGFTLASAPRASAGVSIGIGLGFPVAYPYPYYSYPYPYPYYGYAYPYWYGPGFYRFHGHRVFFSRPFRGARFRHWH